MRRWPSASNPKLANSLFDSFPAHARRQIVELPEEVEVLSCGHAPVQAMLFGKNAHRSAHLGSLPDYVETGNPRPTTR